MRFALLILLSLTIVACSDFQAGELLSNVDSMQDQIQELRDQVDQNQLQDLDELQKNCKELVRELRAYEGDTLEMELAIQFRAFRSMVDRIDPLMDMEKSIDSILTIQEGALKQLHVDISNRHGKRGEYKNFVQFEQEKLENLASSVSEFVKESKDIQQSYDELYESLKSYVIEDASRNDY